jgi:hypothetical protein
MDVRQGDQLARFFAYWAIDYFGQFITKLQKEPKFLSWLLSMVKIYVLILWKNGLGNSLGNFFTNSSGHLDVRTQSEGERKVAKYVVDYIKFW